MWINRLLTFYIFFCCCILTACNYSKEETSIQYELKFPSHLGDFPIDSTNLLTTAGVELGRKLFFDPKLSSNAQVSCATCHKPEFGFADTVALHNIGVSGHMLKRHTPALINLAWHKGFFWDGGANNLESQVLGPLTHADEMNANINEILKYLSNDSTYSKLFSSAFQIKEIKIAYVMRALAQFQKTLIYGDSKFDQFEKGQIIFSQNELSGLTLFKKYCETCHQGSHFSDFKYHNNGLDSNFNAESFEDEVLGRYRITRDSSDLGHYKTPSLRNIAITRPYMHDGRFASLEHVVDHYSAGIQKSPSLSSKIPTEGFQFTKKEKMDLISFLKTLTNEE